MNHLHRANIPLIVQWTLWIALAMFLAGLLGLAINPAYAAGSITSSVTAVKLYRGTSILLSSDPNSTTYRAEFSADACRIEKEARALAEAAGKVMGNPYTAQYKCQIEERDTWSFVATPTCAPPRAPETRQTACPNDPARTFTQTQTWTIAPHPTCEAPTGWAPAIPSAADCPAPPPPPLPAPAGVTATAVSSSEIRVAWNVVPDALAYSLRRCIGASCDPMSQPALRCVQGLTQPHVTLGAEVTVRYQVQASRTADCAGELSQPSAPPVAATTLPAPAPLACEGRVCQISWTHAGTPAEGFRIVFGQAADQLPGSVQVVPGTVRDGQVTVSGPGEWFFAVLAFGGGTESPLSNIQSQMVQ